jgi:glycosyltransferase involved in cell wall biosynthesis
LVADAQQADGTPRVLHVVSAETFAGIERHVIQLTRDLRELGCAAEIACPPRATRLRSEAAAAGIRVIPPADCTSRYWLGAFARDVVADPPDVLNVHDGRSAVAGALLSLVTRCRLVRTQHFARPASLERAGLIGRGSRALHRLINRRLDAYVAVSECVAAGGRDRRETGRGEVVVIAPAFVVAAEDVVSRARSARAGSAHPLVAFAGRLVAERRLDVLLRAIPAVREQAPACRFVLAGSGAAEGDLRALAEALGIADAITWSGWLADPRSVVERAHLYVNTWPWEGFGMATAEAMALAIPIVAVDSGASREIVDPGTTGLLVPGDDPAALAAAIVWVLSDPERAVAMGEAGRRRASALYGAGRTALSTLALYTRLIENVARA